VYKQMNASPEACG